MNEPNLEEWRRRGYPELPEPDSMYEGVVREEVSLEDKYTALNIAFTIAIWLLLASLALNLWFLA